MGNYPAHLMDGNSKTAERYVTNAVSGIQKRCLQLSYARENDAMTKDQANLICHQVAFKHDRRFRGVKVTKAERLEALAVLYPDTPAPKAKKKATAKA